MYIENGYKVRCFHADGREMENDFQLDPESEIGKELSELLAQFDLAHQRRQQESEKGIAANPAATKPV